MGSLSAGHYSIITPVNQFFLLLPFLVNPYFRAAIGMRLIIIAADIGTFILAVELLANLDGKTSFLVPQSISTYWSLPVTF
jgi:hypothetical protein